MHVNFILLGEGTALHISADEGGEPGLLKFNYVDSLITLSTME